MTFNVGYTVLATGSVNTTQNGYTCCSGPYTMPQTGTLLSVTLSAVTAGDTGFLGVYQDNGSAQPGALLATSASTAIAIGSNTFSMTASPVVASGTVIWVCLLGLSNTLSTNLDTIVNNRHFDLGNGGTDTTLLSAFNNAGAAIDNNQYTIYATFAQTGSGASLSMKTLTSQTKPSGKVPLFG